MHCCLLGKAAIAAQHHNWRMTNTPSRTEIAKAFLKTSATFMYHRCAKCGRRLKYKPGAWIGTTGERFTTCRSCGYENPSLMEKVAENLIEAGYDIPDLMGGVLDLAQCLNDGTELQVSKDFTKVFCSNCGREWDRYEFEDIMDGPLAPQLAGAIPISIDNSKTARKLEELLEEAQVDAGSPYLVLQVIEKGSLLDTSFRKAAWAEVKKGWAEGQRGAKSDEPDEQTHYLAVNADSIAHYTWDGKVLDVKEISYEELFKNPSAELEIPFEVRVFKTQMKEVTYLLHRFRVMHLANQKPYTPEIFGTAAREKQKSASPSNSPTNSIAEELKQLAELRAKGIISDEEFQLAKSKLLS